MQVTGNVTMGTNTRNVRTQINQQLKACDFDRIAIEGIL